ncbi:hypothetical protein C4D60_Mb09t09430 [Musa balbisiana]|uniref:Uncharacterized protein n=1 Tax=Musa balbisiana TaxID=52838 RepID=A0A4S8IF74_MUSBA|nr:hypothetical protein C4D60_Mb09t09430 [Musa balbisiana]
MLPFAAASLLATQCSLSTWFWICFLLFSLYPVPLPPLFSSSITSSYLFLFFLFFFIFSTSRRLHKAASPISSNASHSWRLGRRVLEC